MSLYYISPSVMPSRSANSIHVSQMCEAYSNLGHNVTLFVGVSKSQFTKPLSLSDYYGVNFSRVSVEAVSIGNGRGVELRIAMLAVFCFIASFFKKQAPDTFFSRNLYAAFIFSNLFRKKVIYETHAPENEFRKLLQKKIMNCKTVKTVVISEALRTVLLKHHGLKENTDISVFHDAAPSTSPFPTEVERISIREELLDNLGAKHDVMVGYFGHLYPGRGLEIIQSIAETRPQVSILVFGGNEEDISRYREGNKLENLHFKGHIPHDRAIKLMSVMDVLLMPYQRQVSIGISGYDTAQWMSPMKMFEYMSSGTPIISSDLPVLKEVLYDRRNSLLVPPEDHMSWIAALDELIANPLFSKSIATQGFEDYRNKYTWNRRAENILKAMKDQ